MWRKLCTSFKKASSGLCHALALTAKHLAVELVVPVSISPLLGCQLVALDKCPGVRPIGIGEVPRRIIAKTILLVVREDIQSAVGSLQLYAGQFSGVEAAVHAVRESFQKEETEAVLLVDAHNATAFGSVIEVKNWWDEVNTNGPGFGYFVNPVKIWLVVREPCLSAVISAFSGTGVNVTNEGRPHLRSPIGSEAYIIQFVCEKVDLWKSELVTLSSIAQSHPHADLAAYTHGLKHKWSFLSRTTPNINDLLTPLEETL